MENVEEMVGNDIMWQKMIWDINGYVAEKIRRVTSGPFEGSCDKHASAHVDRIKNNHVHMTNLYLQTYTWDTHAHTWIRLFICWCIYRKKDRYLCHLPCHFSEPWLGCWPGGVPIGDIRIFDPQKLHLPMGSWTDAHAAWLPKARAGKGSNVSSWVGIVNFEF